MKLGVRTKKWRAESGSRSLLAENWSRHTAELASLVVLSLLGKWPIGCAVQDDSLRDQSY